MRFGRSLTDVLQQAAVLEGEGLSCESDVHLVPKHVVIEHWGSPTVIGPCGRNVKDTVELQIDEVRSRCAGLRGVVTNGCGHLVGRHGAYDGRAMWAPSLG